MRVSLIAAASENNVIGDHGKIPWNIPEDLQYLRRVTEVKPVVMGRKTYESIGRPLPKRRNIVITRQKGYIADGCEVVDSLDAALDLVEKAESGERKADDEIFVIGGGEIYREALSHADRIYLTRVHATIPGDAYFPEFHPDHWTEMKRERHEGSPPYTFLVYERKL